jgi:hypothetical protein
MQATVADELLVQSLPQEIQDAITRIYGEPSEGAKLYTEEDLEEAYREGFNDAVEQIEPHYPAYSSHDFKAWMKYRR